MISSKGHEGQVGARPRQAFVGREIDWIALAALTSVARSLDAQAA